MRRDMKALADGLIEVVKGYVQQASNALAGRLDAVERRFDALPMSKDGADGKDGKDGRDGKDAEPIDPQTVISAVLAELETPQPGKDGRDGKDGQDGKSFTAEDAKALLEPEIAKWALDFERRAQDTLQRTIDRLPKPKDGVDGSHGRDGVDALGFDDLTVQHDGERGFTLMFVSGERVKEFTFSVPVVLDRGYYREGEAFQKGDGVTFAGSYWIAQGTTQTKPEIGNEDWRLAVKKGRDAKTPANLEAAK